MPQSATASGVSSIVSPYLATCYTNIIWSCIDADLPKSAVFYAERYYALDHNNHDARHIYATSLIRSGQTQSALYLLREEQCTSCCGCLQLKSQACSVMGRYRQAQEALEGSLKDPDYVPTRKFIFHGHFKV
jgi:anaphase-promoting complex subunit 3